MGIRSSAKAILSPIFPTSPCSPALNLLFTTKYTRFTFVFSQFSLMFRSKSMLSILKLPVRSSPLAIVFLKLISSNASKLPSIFARLCAFRNSTPSAGVIVPSCISFPLIFTDDTTSFTSGSE